MPSINPSLNPSVAHARTGPMHTAISVVVGALVAITATLALVHAFSASAAPGDTDATFNPTAGCRITDTRGPDNIGPRSTPLGAGEVFEVAIHGDNGECIGDLAVPAHATAIAANVTAVGATTSSNLRVYPANLTDVPLLSSLNVTAGGAPTPNMIDVQLSPDGKINIYNFRGSLDVVIDIVGYYTPNSLQELAATAGTPGPQGPQGPEGPQGPAGPTGVVEMQHGFGPDEPLSGVIGADVDHTLTRVDVATPNGDTRYAVKHLQGPASIAGVDYALTSVEYCLGIGITPGASLDEVEVRQNTSTSSSGVVAFDSTPKNNAGCYVLPVNDTEARSAFMMIVGVSGDSANDSVAFRSISTTWTPLS